MDFCLELVDGLGSVLLIAPAACLLNLITTLQLVFGRDRKPCS
jgi:hypothetical protein